MDNCFILRPDKEPAAVAALRAYAAATDNGVLAEDIYNWVGKGESLRPQGEWSECDWVEYNGHGECIHHPKAGLRCSNCCNAFKKELLWKDNYCPNCGAKMGGTEDV